MSNFLDVAIVGSDANGSTAIEQLQPLLADDEKVTIATHGDGGGALFTNKRLILVNDAGLFTKRSIVRFIKRSAIDAVSIDASSLLEVKIAGNGFGMAHLIFDADLDPVPLSRWFADAMASTDTKGGS